MDDLRRPVIGTLFGAAGDLPSARRSNSYEQYRRPFIFVDANQREICRIEDAMLRKTGPYSPRSGLFSLEHIPRKQQQAHCLFRQKEVERYGRSISIFVFPIGNAFCQFCFPSDSPLNVRSRRQSPPAQLPRVLASLPTGKRPNHPNGCQLRSTSPGLRRAAGNGS
jgi:hypothetical protein